MTLVKQLLIQASLGIDEKHRLAISCDCFLSERNSPRLIRFCFSRLHAGVGHRSSGWTLPGIKWVIKEIGPSQLVWPHRGQSCFMEWTSMKVLAQDAQVFRSLSCCVIESKIKKPL